jgi:hypothetical protein
MTQAQTKIIELFQALPAAEQRDIIAALARVATTQTFFDRMTPDQRLELELSTAQADRGEGDQVVDVFDRLATDFGYPRTS